MSKGSQKNARLAALVEALRQLKPAITTIAPEDPLDAVAYKVPPQFKSLLDAATDRFADYFPLLAKEVGLPFVGEMTLYLVGPHEGEPTEKTVEDIKVALEKFSVETWSVFRIVRGASLEHGTSCTLGPFTFLQWPEEAAQLKAAPHLPESHLREALYLDTEDRCIFVSTRFRGYRHFRAAEAFADERFEQLENVLRYMLGDQSGYDLGIFEFREPHLRRCVSVSPSWTTMRVEPRGTAAFVPMDLPLFKDEALGHDRLWTLLGDANARSEMEGRILTAVEWIGRGVYDVDPTKGFVQSMFAYEALLNYEGDDKAKFSPSLGHGMAEIAAFVLSEEREHRKFIWNQLRELYGKRCGIAHGGKTTASREERHEACAIVSRLVTQLLVDPQLKQFPRLLDLRNWTTDKRFS